MTENTRTRVATEQISRRIVMRIAGFHFVTADYSPDIRGYDN